MLSYSSMRRSASSPRAASSATKPAQHRDDIGADVAIVARQHRGNASTRRQSYAPTAKLRCTDINHARASRGEGRTLNERLTFLHNRETISANIMTQQEMRAEPSPLRRNCMRALLVGALAATLVGCSCLLPPQASIEGCTDANGFACFDRTAASQPPEPASFKTNSATTEIKSTIAA